MGRKCSVPDCGSNYESRLRQGRHATSTFKFPDDPAIREQWVAAVARPDGWQPKKTSCICMNHFRQDDFEKLHKPAKLKADAVPTLFGCSMADYEPVKQQSGPPEELNVDFEGLYGRVLEKAEFAGWHFYRMKDILHFYTVEDSGRDSAIQIVNSVKIFEDMKLNVFVKEVKQPDAIIRRVLGRDLKLCRWSQFEAILKKYELKSHNSEKAEGSKSGQTQNDIQMVFIPGADVKREPADDTETMQDATELDMDIVKEETNVTRSDEDSDRESDHSPVEKVNLYEALRNLSQSKNKCYICDLNHETKDQYDYHLTSHMDMLPYECDRCVTEKVVIQSLPTLNKHYLMHLKPLKCRTCDARFTTYKSRSIHEKSFHVAAESVSCEICGETFLSQKRYKKHLHTHTEIDAVSCKICEKQFNHAFDLDSHMKSVHPSSASFNYEELSTLDPNVKEDFSAKQPDGLEQPKKEFFCIECNKHLPTANSYYSHMQSHRKQFQCGYCGVRIARIRDFRDHENTHTGKRPYECEICKMRFMAASTYYGHKATHRGEKKFACETCGRTFSRKDHMVSHANTHKKLLRRGRRPVNPKKEVEPTEAVQSDGTPVATNSSTEGDAEKNAASNLGSVKTEMEF